VEWQPAGEPAQVLVHDFPDPKVGKAIPYGVYDLGAGTGWVSVGCDHDTAAFAVATLRRWWEQAGRAVYPDADRLLVTADGVSALAGTELDPLFRLKDVNTLVLTGVATQFAVEGTAGGGRPRLPCAGAGGLLRQPPPRGPPVLDRLILHSLCEVTTADRFISDLEATRG
jgi:hypothetical protein